MSANSNVYTLTSGTGGAGGSGYISSGAGSTINSTGLTGTCITTSPYLYTQPINYYYSYPAPQVYDIQLRKVENGWIMHKDGKEYILTSLEEVSKYNKESK